MKIVRAWEEEGVQAPAPYSCTIKVLFAPVFVPAYDAERLLGRILKAAENASKPSPAAQRDCFAAPAGRLAMTIGDQLPPRQLRAAHGGPLRRKIGGRYTGRRHSVSRLNVSTLARSQTWAPAARATTRQIEGEARSARTRVEPGNAPRLPSPLVYIVSRSVVGYLHKSRTERRYKDG